MPTYEYECKKCGWKFEVFQNMTDKKLTKCPKCHAQKAKRLIGSGAGIIFKGSGFYATDYKKSKPSKDTCPAAKSDSPKCSDCQLNKNEKK